MPESYEVPTVGALIRQSRVAASLTQPQVVDRVLAIRATKNRKEGFSASHLSDIENGRIPAPQKETLADLATALEMNGDRRMLLFAVREIAAKRAPRQRSDEDAAAPNRLAAAEDDGVREAVSANIKEVVAPSDLITPAGDDGEPAQEDVVEGRSATPAKRRRAAHLPGQVLVVAAFLAGLGVALLARGLLPTPNAKPGTKTYILQPYLRMHQCGDMPTQIGDDYYMQGRPTGKECNSIQWIVALAPMPSQCAFYAMSPTDTLSGHVYRGTIIVTYDMNRHGHFQANYSIAPQPYKTWYYFTTVDPRAITFSVGDDGGLGTMGLGPMKAACSG